MSNFTDLVDRGARILDVGCGNADFLVQLRSDGFTDLHGIEPDERLTRTVRDQFDIKHCPAEHIERPDHSFDVVWVYGVLHHLMGDDAYVQATAGQHAPMIRVRDAEVGGSNPLASKEVALTLASD